MQRITTAPAYSEFTLATLGIGRLTKINALPRRWYSLNDVTHR
jgi:hypothetical protein